MALDRETTDAWLRRYVAAWKTYDRDEIGSLFAETPGTGSTPATIRGPAAPRSLARGSAMALRPALPPGTSPGPTTRRTPPLRSRAMWPLQPGAPRICRSPAVRWTVCSTTASSCDSTIRAGVANSPNGSWNVRSGRVCRRIARTYCCRSIAMTTYSLEPDEQQMRAIAERALDFVVDFISSLPDAPHVDLDGLPGALARIRSDAPETGTGFDELIDQI